MSTRSFLPSLWGRADDNDVFRSLHNEIDRVFHDFNRGFGWPTTTGPSPGTDLQLSPRIDVSETENAVEVSAELPGVDESDVEVHLVDNMLTIKGKKSAEKDEKKKDYHVVERTYGAFQRSISLPFDADPERVDATFEKGVLTVMLPKPPESEAKTQKINIRSAS